MTVQRIAKAEVAARAVGVLGLDPEAVDLLSIEALCSSLRRTASFLCPASPRQIVDVVMNVLAPLAGDLDRDTLAEALDALVMSGDLLELRQPGERSRLLFLGPPSFVEKHPGEYLLLGIRPQHVTLVDETVDGIEVIHDAHTRSVLLDAETGQATLVAAGLHRVSKEQWTKAPRVESSAQVIDRLRERLAGERAAPGFVTGLTIIDPSQPMGFYKGRWREPTEEHTGIFTGRRPQAYGAPIWCAVETVAGIPQSVLDLPVDSSIAPGWDEARRIQAALDAENGTPQAFRVRGAPSGGGTFFDFFAPLPTWAERYLAISGWPAPKGPKSLFTYCLPAAAVDDAEQFLSASLWMTSIKEDQ